MDLEIDDAGMFIQTADDHAQVHAVGWVNLDSPAVTAVVVEMGLPGPDHGLRARLGRHSSPGVVMQIGLPTGVCCFCIGDNIGGITAELNSKPIF